MSPKILIAGGYGLVGSLIAKHIRQAGFDTELILAGRTPERGRALASELGRAHTVRLDIEDPAPGLRDAGAVDLIVAALNDPSDALLLAAVRAGIAHIGITKTADKISPIVAAAASAPPAAPIVLLGHWQAGVLTLATRHAAQEFAAIDRVEMAALYDYADPIGPMTAEEAGSFVGRALLRQSGNWVWVDAREHTREVVQPSGAVVVSTPMGVLDLPSVAAFTSAPNIRFDLGIGQSLGTRAGAPASHELVIDISGRLMSGEQATRRTVVSDPAGQAHLTALGVLVAIERVLGIDGQPCPPPGIQFPESFIRTSAAIARFNQFGVQISTG